MCGELLFRLSFHNDWVGRKTGQPFFMQAQLHGGKYRHNKNWKRRALSELGGADAPDSFNLMPALLGKSKVGRERLVEQASVLSLRVGQWKYIEPGRGPKIQRNTNTETGNDPDGQLYNLADDLGETSNLITKYPDRAKEMAARLQQIKQNNRTRP